MNKRLNDAERNQIRTLYKKGLSGSALAAKFKCSTTTIYGLCNGLRKETPKKKLGLVRRMIRWLFRL